MSLVANERIKLTAGLLNSVAGFSITAGGVGPLIALTYGINAPSTLSPMILGIMGAIWLSVGACLHATARWVVGRLDT